MTADDKRAFILNKGSGSVSVINVINNALDSTTPTITLPTITYTGGTATPNPVWADISPTTDQLVILNQGNSLASTSALTYSGTYAAGTTYAQNAVVSYQGGTYVDNSAVATPAGTLPTNTAYFTQLHPGSLSLIDIPLCSSITQITNPNCNSANPTDAATFGTITSSANVGINPVMVSVLHDGTAAYVANQFDSTGTCNAGEGSVSVVNLVTGVVTATLCGVSGSAATVSQNGVYSFPTLVYGHPNTISATTGTPTGKVYVTSSDSQYMSIIYTNTNTVAQHVNLQGNAVRVLMTTP
jgi:DNA-binding beta-propeller fold protein YncE